MFFFFFGIYQSCVSIMMILKLLILTLRFKSLRSDSHLPPILPHLLIIKSKSNYQTSKIKAFKNTNVFRTSWCASPCLPTPESSEEKKVDQSSITEWNFQVSARKYYFLHAQPPYPRHNDTAELRKKTRKIKTSMTISTIWFCTQCL